MAQANTPVPKSGYRDGDSIVFLWERKAPPEYDHFDLQWGVSYYGSWDEQSGKVIAEAADPLHYFKYGYNKTGEAYGYGNSATSSFAKAFSAEDWYPFQNRICVGMRFVVRGDTVAQGASTAQTRSAWSKLNSDGAKVNFEVPRPPVCTASRSGGSTTFTWRSPDSEQSLRWCSEVQVQTRLGSGSWETVEQDATWASGESVTGRGWREPSGSCTLTESESTQAGASSSTRRYRARCRGPRGASAWTEVEAWTWAKPNKPAVTATGSGRSAASDVLAWSYTSEGGRPAERIVPERSIGTPATAAGAPPASASWTAGTPSAIAQDASGRSFIAIDPVGVDECVWMRATAYHGDLSATSGVLVTHRGRLAAPTGMTATRSGTTATLTWSDATQVPGARVVLYQRPGRKTSGWEAVWDDAVSAISQRSHTVTGLTTGVSYDFKAVAEKEGWTDSYGAYALSLGRPGKPTIQNIAFSRDKGIVWVKWDSPDAATASVEVTYSGSRYAWYSTGGYESSVIEGKPTERVIEDYALGERVYVRVRWLDADGAPGEWSEIADVLCATAPDNPVLQASKGALKPGDSVGFAWSYANEDGSDLSRSVLHVTRGGSTVNVGRSNGVTQATLWGSTTRDWASGQTVSVTVSVTSANGMESEESDPVTVEVMSLPATTVALGTGTGSGFVSLPYVTTEVDGASGRVRTLSAPPLTVRATSGNLGDGGTVTIRRYGAYAVEHGDGTVERGADGERVAAKAYSGAASYVQFPGVDFDEGGLYRAEVEAYNEVGSTVAVSEPFHVSWSNKASAPTATAAADGMAAVVTPSYTDSREMCDVYRITADGLQLVMANAEWGAPVTDPYAPLGKEGATHRVVSRTAAGDEAWVEVDAGNPQQGIVIDWDGKRVELPYNNAISDGYSKRYTATRHRGGTITGKWLEGVERTASWESGLVKVSDQGKVLLLRELARWCGECYLRGPHGIGFPCNVDVSVRAEYNSGAVEASIAATRVDSAEWGGGQ